ncbi:hypothetical protein F4X33_04230 [Candidatus Poribacteria bacterium]|nr:hypothetical protein [Candidatus Poribacteria bacterium]
MAELLTVAMRGVTRRDKARLALSTEEPHSRFKAKFIPANHRRQRHGTHRERYHKQAQLPVGQRVGSGWMPLTWRSS